MRRFFLALLVVSLIAAGCSRPGGKQTTDSPAAAPLPIQGVAHGDFVIGKPVTFENLTLFAIASKTARNDDRFITLDEGLAAGTVTIIEMDPFGNADEDDPFGGPDEDDPFGGPIDYNPFASANEEDPVAVATPPQHVEKQTEQEEDSDGPFDEPAEQPAADQQVEQIAQAVEESGQLNETEYQEEVAGDVNQLSVLNTSGKPLYLMPGEVISGGKQDRTIGEEVVIKSGDQPVPIGVFCVEQGRWQGRSVAQLVELISVEGASISAAAGGAGASVEDVDVAAVAEAANRGQFVASVGQVSKGVRLAVQLKKAQGEVWKSVGKLNASVGNDSESSNLAACFAKGEIADNLSKYVEQLKPLGETNQIVGVAVAVNGKMLSVDVFESTPLFRKLWPKLLKSYALDAVAAAGAKDDADPATRCTIDQCLAFVAAARAGKTEADRSADGAVVSRTDSQAAASFAYYDAEVAAETGIAAGVETGGAGFGGGGFGNLNPVSANGNSTDNTAQPVHSSILAN